MPPKKLKGESRRKITADADQVEGLKPPKKIKTEKAQKKTGSSKEISDTSFSLKSYLTEKSWENVLRSEFSKDFFIKLEEQLAKDYSDKQEIFPPRELIFNCFSLTPFKKVKVVILGQDPYHDNGQAHGLSFSVPKGINPPPSLKNIYKELMSDIPGFKTPDHGCLESWAKQGVLFLNATLTVQAHKANSHAKYGWQTFTDHVIRTISDQADKLVFILWGGFAHKKEKLIDGTKHHVIKTAHPSPLSCTKFFGCKCFSQANQALKKFKKEEIDWSL